MHTRSSTALVALFAVLSSGIASAETVWLDSLNLSVATQGWGEPGKNHSVQGGKLSIGGHGFDRGFGTHAESRLNIALNGGAQNFSASVGVDDEVNGNPASSVEFSVIGDGKVLWTSGVMRAASPAKDCSVDVTGVRTLVLKVGDAGDGTDYDHADWANAKFETASATTFATSGESAAAPVAPYILTPAAPAAPRINGATVFGVRPGSPFLYSIAATGERPMTFWVKGLPDGLEVDRQTGHITGSLKNKGEFVVTLGASNLVGRAEKKFRIVCGDQIALTPPMGWNSWNCFAAAVSEDRVKRAADAMVKSGLINHGWTYINVDDYWQNHRNSKDPTLHGDFRDTNGFIVPNSRFPDMKGLADYIHGLGLKAGLYSSPGPWTCGGCTGSYQHEDQDAQTYARWGFDYLKYDWCSYGAVADGQDPTSPRISTFGQGRRGRTDLATAVHPYEVMGKALRAQPRDIVYSLCQYGMSDVWKWGGSVNGNCWRTTGDITDTWRSMSNIGFKQDREAPYAKPGNWNDPDMLIVGQVGWGNLHPTRLTVDEQYTHISLWCLLSAPLLIGCDMEKFDDFTLNLLSNDEVLALDQDALGKEATCVFTNEVVRAYAKPLEDGGQAIGFFNLGTSQSNLNFTQFAPAGLAGKLHVRDLWRQKDLADVNADGGTLPIIIPAHGVVLYKFTPAK
jgi:alpha-galactosidase